MLKKKNKYLHTLELTQLGQDSSFSWYDSSVKVVNEYKVNKGSQGVNWKNRGYAAVFDILTVFD